MLVPECDPEAEREPGVYTDGASKAIREQAEAERGIVIQFRVARRVAGSQAQEEFNFSPETQSTRRCTENTLWSPW